MRPHRAGVQLPFSLCPRAARRNGPGCLDGCQTTQVEVVRQVATSRRCRRESGHANTITRCHCGSAHRGSRLTHDDSVGGWSGREWSAGTWATAASGAARERPHGTTRHDEGKARRGSHEPRIAGETRPRARGRRYLSHRTAAHVVPPTDDEFASTRSGRRR